MMPTTPKKNGELCTKGDECSSGRCDRNDKGESHCYGGVAINSGCSGDFDCTVNSKCAKRTINDAQGVCVDMRNECDMKSECLFAVSVSACQLQQFCQVKPVDFNACIQSECSIDGYSDMTCDAVKGLFDNLNTSKCCPNPGFTGGDCILSTQCGCPSGRKCDLVDESGFTRCGSAGLTTPGSLCAQSSDCLPGYGCIGGVCKRYCSGSDSQECGSDNVCNSIGSGNDPIPGAFYCSRVCDPVNPTSSAQPYSGCGAGAGCSSDPSGHSDCYAGSATGTLGASCATANGQGSSSLCAPGYYCSVGNTCLRYCHVGSTSECSAGTCVSFSTKEYAGTAEIGHCSTTSTTSN
jgi:hypothetical protein